MKWDYKDGWRSSHCEIVDDDDWRSIENYMKLQDREGVYLFADVNLQVKYISKAGAGRMIAKIEYAIRRGKDRGATQVKTLYTNSTANAQKLENYLIRIYQPNNNMTF